MTSQWLEMQCPDCMKAAARRDDCEVRCAYCGRTFPERDGILYLLPNEIRQRELKEREKQGWCNLCARGDDSLREDFLGLPFSHEGETGPSYYREASRQFRFATDYLGPIKGLKGMDLGGSIGWAAYRFALLGAQMVLADFNDATPSGLGGAQTYIDQGVWIDRICVDAERLPLSSEQFDFVFCCAFLHHLTNPKDAIAHISRILKPGGVFIATCEAFCPWWMSRQKALACSQIAQNFTHEGVNEQVFYMSEYRCWFKGSGLSLQVANPRWDEVGPRILRSNRKLAEESYEPEILRNRAGKRGISGVLARISLAMSLWRPLAHPLPFSLMRPLLLNSTQKLRILIGTKIA